MKRQVRQIVFGLCGFLMFLFKGPSASVGDVILSPLVVETMSTFECQSTLDIHIQFTNASDNTTRKIAECETAVKACHLADQSFGKHFSVSYTGFGARFGVMTGNDETNGEYSCCETFSSERICVTMEIKPQSLNAFMNNSITEDNEEMHDEQAKCTDTYNANLLLVMCLCIFVTVVVSVVVAVIAAFRLFQVYVLPGRKNCKEKDYFDDTHLHRHSGTEFPRCASRFSLNSFNARTNEKEDKWIENIIKDVEVAIKKGYKGKQTGISIHGLGDVRSKRKTNAKKHANYVNIELKRMDLHEGDGLADPNMDQMDTALQRPFRPNRNEMDDDLFDDDDDILDSDNETGTMVDRRWDIV